MPLLINLLGNPFVCVFVVFPYLVGLPWVRLGSASCTSSQKFSDFPRTYKLSFFHTRKNQRTFPLTFIFFSSLSFFFLLLRAILSLLSPKKKAHTEWEKISSFFHCYTQHLLDGFSFFLFWFGKFVCCITFGAARNTNFTLHGKS